MWLTTEESLNVLTRKNHVFIPQAYLLMMGKKRRIHTKRTGTASRLYWGPDVHKYRITLRV